MDDKNKMNWLIEDHKNGNVVYEIQATHRNHGAISKPTGSGKSSLFIPTLDFAPSIQISVG